MDLSAPVWASVNKRSWKTSFLKWRITTFLQASQTAVSLLTGWNMQFRCRCVIRLCLRFFISTSTDLKLLMTNMDIRQETSFWLKQPEGSIIAFGSLILLPALEATNSQ